jgi:hypothetical protein
MVLAGGLLVLTQAGHAAACSAPFEQPTLAALGPEQIVVVGSIEEPVAGGRHFAVEHWYNGSAPRSDLVIAFKEGEPTGDCSYRPVLGEPIIVAPVMAANGALSADLTTLQAPIGSEDGRRYLAEAQRLFGPGLAPPVDLPGASESTSAWRLVALVAVSLAVIGVAGIWVIRTLRAEG